MKLCRCMTALRLFALLAVVTASPGVCQVASSMDFRGTETASSGAKVVSSGSFTLFELGHWQQSETDKPDIAQAVSPASNALRPSACTALSLPPFIPGLARATAQRRLQWWGRVAEAECRHDLPAGLLDAIVIQESRYSPAAVSPAGAAGLAQLMPFTARDLRVENRFDPIANLDGGARYLRAMLEKFRSVPIALAAYNAGPGAVGRAGGIPRNSETPGYVRSVMGYWSSTSADPLSPVRQTALLLGFLPPSPQD